MALQNIKQIKGSTQGSVLFLGPNGIVSENNNQLYWNVNNNTLGVGGKLGVGAGKLNPVFDIDVNGTSSTTYLRVTDGATAGYVLSSVDSTGNAVWISPDSLVSGLIGATNGLYDYNGYVGLGGTVSQNTIIDGNGYYISLTNFDYIYFTGSTFDVESSLISLDAGTGSIQLLAYQDVVILSDTGQISLTSNSGQVTTSNLEGLVYTSDYSATFVTYSLVTKGYVDSLSFSASGVINYIPYWTSTNTLSSTSSIYDDGSSVGIGTVSNPSYKVNVVGDVNITGTLYATSKSFEIEHPLDSNKRLVYGSLEGPEYGVYHRGKLNNEFVINLPDYWIELVDENSISVNITPFGSHQRLFVEKIENNKVYIGSDNSGSPRCYYVVYAERKDIPKIIVEK